MTEILPGISCIIFGGGVKTPPMSVSISLISDLISVLSALESTWLEFCEIVVELEKKSNYKNICIKIGTKAIFIKIYQSISK